MVHKFKIPIVLSVIGMFLGTIIYNLVDLSLLTEIYKISINDFWKNFLYIIEKDIVLFIFIIMALITKCKNNILNALIFFYSLILSGQFVLLFRYGHLWLLYICIGYLLYMIMCFILYSKPEILKNIYVVFLFLIIKNLLLNFFLVYF